MRFAVESMNSRADLKLFSSLNPISKRIPSASGLNGNFPGITGADSKRRTGSADRKALICFFLTTLKDELAVAKLSKKKFAFTKIKGQGMRTGQLERNLTI